MKKAKPKTKVIRKTYKLRVYPTLEQKLILQCWFGNSRFIYNKILEYKNKAYKRRKESINKKKASEFITHLKKQPSFAWLKSTPRDIYTQKLVDLETAFTNFFEGRTKYPKFKKKTHQQKVRLQLDQRLTNRKNNYVSGKIDIPSLGLFKYRNKTYHPQQYPKMITITQNTVGQYFVTMMIEYTQSDFNQIVQAKRKNKTEASNFHSKTFENKNKNSILGIDLGIKDLIIDSNGNKESNIKTTAKYARNLKLKNRQLSNKQKGSNNWHKQKKKVSQCHDKIANVRKNYLHNISTKLVNENQVLAIEDLCVKNMVKNKKLSKAISDASWGELVRQLEYKAQWYGTVLIKINRYYASSKKCSACETINHKLTLKDRFWTCQSCGTTHDRDINAAINISTEGKKELFKLIQQGLIDKDLLPLLSEILSDNKNNTKSINQSSSKNANSKKKLPWGAREVKHVDNDILLYNQ
jgi:putative transposase